MTTVRRLCRAPQRFQKPFERLLPRHSFSRNFSHLALRNQASYLHPCTRPASIQRQRLPTPFSQARQNSTNALPFRPPAVASQSVTEEDVQNVSSYELTFTCKPCGNRSTHKITKHGYHKGTVVIRCPECKNLHLISDHLKVRRQTHCVQIRPQSREALEVALM